MVSLVYYCCVAKGVRILQEYNGGDFDIENLAVLCLKSAPPYHRWYAQSMGKKTYGFLMEDGFVYFAIADIGLGNRWLLRFLEHVRDEFKNIAKRERSLGSYLNGKSVNLSTQLSNLSSVSVQEQLVPVICQLIRSLQYVSKTSDHGLVEPSSLLYGCDTYGYGEFEPTTSTKAPLLGRNMVGIEMEENRKSADRRCRGESDSSNQDVTVAVTVNPTPLQKEMSGSMRMRTASQAAKRRWCRWVRLVLIIDVAVCIILFLVWLLICGGVQCLKS